MSFEVFEEVEDFPGYEVTNQGRVFSLKMDRFLKATPHPTRGWYYVGLSRPGEAQVKVPLHHLVAQAFLMRPENPNTSVLHKDADRSNNRSDNLMWAPRWFVVKYMQQMNDPERYRGFGPLVCENTEDVFQTIYDFARETLTLPSDVFKGAYSEHRTYPKYGYVAPPNRMAEHKEWVRKLEAGEY